MRPPSERLELPDAWGTSRASRLFPGWWLAHADLHNHTRLSDGAGDPRLAFASMRAAGLDVAALTDHSRWASVFLDRFKAPGWTGMDGRGWRQTIALAEAANADGEFVALHGFEWSHYAQGHMNVWNSGSFTDPLRTAPTMGRFWRWLEGPGDDGLAGFNHPGTGRLRFDNFGYRPAMARRLVSLELFNKLDDYLLKGTDRGRQSPLNQCLNAGWRVGLLGVTDEHGADWGHPEGKGRAGLWVRELTRAGVLEALAARRFFASRVKGLRVDAALTSLAGAGGSRARMGT
ncbi:MAG: CehA/McbA family metallohydrolase, partial [Actinomycetota bacterium]